MELMKNGHTIRTMDDWLSFAPPKKGLAHWAEGRSAYECARAWCAAAEGPSGPAELTALLGSHPDIAGVVVQTVMPEHRVRFDKLRGEPRNADVARLVLVRVRRRHPLVKLLRREVAQVRLPL